MVGGVTRSFGAGILSRSFPQGPCWEWWWVFDLQPRRAWTSAAGWAQMSRRIFLYLPGHHSGNLFIFQDSTAEIMIIFNYNHCFLYDPLHFFTWELITSVSAVLGSQLMRLAFISPTLWGGITLFNLACLQSESFHLNQSSWQSRGMGKHRRM